LFFTRENAVFSTFVRGWTSGGGLYDLSDSRLLTVKASIDLVKEKTVTVTVMIKKHEHIEDKRCLFSRPSSKTSYVPMYSERWRVGKVRFVAFSSLERP